MNAKYGAILPFTLLLIVAAGSAEATSILGSAVNYAALGAAAVTTTGSTTTIGEVGTSADLDPAAVQAESDAEAAFTSLMALGGATDLTGADLGGLTLLPGIYKFSSSAGLSGVLTLNFDDEKNAAFVFQIGSTLITGSNTSVIVENGDPGSAVFWGVGSSATLGVGTSFAGNILAAASVTLNTGASIIPGRAIALAGAVTLDTNEISTNTLGGGDFSTGRRDFGSLGLSGGGTPSLATPEPATWAVMLLGMAMVGGYRRTRRAGAARG